MKSHVAAAARATTNQTNHSLIKTYSPFDRAQFEEAIACRAYELFESRGRKDGQDQADWLRAESELLHPHSSQVIEQGR